MVVAVPFLSAGLGLSCFAARKSQASTGRVSDAMCGAQHMEPGATPAQCTRVCVCRVAKYGLVVRSRVYTLDTDNKEDLDDLQTQTTGVVQWKCDGRLRRYIAGRMPRLT